MYTHIKGVQILISLLKQFNISLLYYLPEQEIQLWLEALKMIHFFTVIRL